MEKIYKSLREFIVNNKFFLLIITFYFLIRIFNILTPPVFNDEAIYLDWGWRETNSPGYLYYSLYDAKQPLLMWIFGIMQHIFSDPLFAGRIVSVFAGLITLVGIYKISINLFNKKVALLSSLLYTVVPIFSFFDRQALMESSIAAIGIWTGYFVIKLAEKKTYLNGIIIGIILGLGFFIKSSALLFLLSFFISSLYLIKGSSKKGKIIEIIFITISTFLVTTLLLLINPEFWRTFSSNSRFTLTFLELLRFPIGTWISSIIVNLQILFFYFTPIIFFLSLIGIFQISKKTTKYKVFIIFFILCLIVETFTVKGATDRYLVSFIPFLVICASFIGIKFYEKNKKIGLPIISFLIVIPFVITLYQVFDFPNYLINMGKVSYYSNSAYLSTNTSGYGLNESIKYFKTLPNKEKIVIGIAQNTGNPESGFQIYFNKDQKPRVVYLDASLLGEDLSKYDCLSTGVTTYFVSRDEQQAGLEKFFKKIKTIKNPYFENTIGIYKLIDNCKGRILKVEIKRS
jgi:4-amino-4-deoxy-L-arabinose transferase-like glycosyltransferase